MKTNMEGDVFFHYTSGRNCVAFLRDRFRARWVHQFVFIRLHSRSRIALNKNSWIAGCCDRTSNEGPGHRDQKRQFLQLSDSGGSGGYYELAGKAMSFEVVVESHDSQ